MRLSPEVGFLHIFFNILLIRVEGLCDWIVMEKKIRSLFIRLPQEPNVNKPPK